MEISADRISLWELYFYYSNAILIFIIYNIQVKVYYVKILKTKPIFNSKKLTKTINNQNQKYIFIYRNSIEGRMT